MENTNRKNKKRRLLKVLAFSVLFLSVGILSFVLPIQVQNNKKITLNNDFSLNTYIGNKNRINNFIDSYISDNHYNLSGSLKVYGDDEIIGQSDKELTSQERSLITVEEASNISKDNERNQIGLFKLDLNSNFKYEMNKNNINYELDYVKPYYSDSTYPLVGIKLFYGEGASYYETYYEYRDTNLYGFKKNITQTIIETYVNDINENPNEYFKLKDEVGVIGQTGLYAKNIKSTDFDLNTPILKEMRKNNYRISINNLYVDENNPSLLRIVYTITFDNGEVTNYISNKEVKIGNFDIHVGVDDPESKVKKFISDNKEWIEGLNQYFTYEQEKDEEGNPTKDKIKISEAYQQGKIKFNPNYSIRSKLKSSGIKLEFKQWHEDMIEPYAFAYEFDSTTPMYRLDITSYADTPLEYSEHVYIEGTRQQGEFLESENETKMEKFINYLYENHLGLEDVFDFDWDTSTNPLSLSDYFINNGVQYQSNSKKYNISFNIVQNLYNAYIENSNNSNNPYKDKKPFDKFKFKKIKTLNDAEFDAIAEKIKDDMNKIENLEDILSGINTSNSTDPIFEINVCLGDKKSGTLFTLIDPLQISVINHFETNENYNLTTLEQISNWVQNNQSNIIIELNTSNGNFTNEGIASLLKERKYKDIFSKAVIYNIDETNFQFSEFRSQLEININFSNFEKLTPSDIEKIITDQNIEIEIVLSIDKTTKSFKIFKTFDELIQGK